MSIRRFFNQSIVVRRLRTAGGSKKSFQATATVEGHIQELSPAARQLQGIIQERAWEAWFPEDCIIKEGDTVTDEHGVDYKVREVTVKDYGINQHMQVILEEQNE